MNPPPAPTLPSAAARVRAAIARLLRARPWPRATAPTMRTVDVHGGDVLRLDVPPGSCVQVLFGSIWLTAPNRLDDVFAASGDEVVLDAGAGVLVEAQGFARLVVCTPACRPAVARVVDALRRRARPAPSALTGAPA